MKTQKIFLLALVLLLALGLASCAGAEKSTAPECFVFDEQASFSDSLELVGTVVDYNYRYDLVAIENVQLSDSGESTRTVEIIDMADGNRVIFKDKAVASAGTAHKDREYDIEHYPIIGVTRYVNSGTDVDGLPIYDSYTDYYLVDANATIDTDNTDREIAADLKEDDAYISVNDENNVFIADVGDKTYWISPNLEIMRSVLSDVSDSYYINSDYDAEHNGYLYVYNFDPDSMVTTVIVYAPSGVASAQYNFSAGTAYSGDSLVDPKMYVLNNGNVLIQECIIVEDGEEYDFTYGAHAQKLKLATKIMDHTNGAVYEVDFKYLISEFESAYAYDGYGEFYFALADGYYNQAYIISVADGVVGREIEYVVLSNNLERVYTLKNKYMANYGTYSTIQNADKDGYSAYAIVDGSDSFCRFDWNGNILFTYPTNAEYDGYSDYYLGAAGIYANDGTLVFDLDGFGAEDVDIYGSVAFVEKTGYTRNVRDEYGNVYDRFVETLTYRIDLTTGKETLVANDYEKEAIRVLSSDGSYMRLESKKNLASVYNKDGETVLVIRVDKDGVNTIETQNSLVICTEVGAEHKVYILNNLIWLEMPE